MTQALRQTLPNGWTFSISPDLSGVGYSVAAYPTPTNPPEPGPRRWFQFADGSEEQRVFCFDSVLPLYMQVSEAPTP